MWAGALDNVNTISKAVVYVCLSCPLFIFSDTWLYQTICINCSIKLFLCSIYICFLVYWSRSVLLNEIDNSVIAPVLRSDITVWSKDVRVRHAKYRGRERWIKSGRRRVSVHNRVEVPGKMSRNEEESHHEESRHVHCQRRRHIFQKEEEKSRKHANTFDGIMDYHSSSQTLELRYTFGIATSRSTYRVSTRWI